MGSRPHPSTTTLQALHPKLFLWGTERPSEPAGRLREGAVARPQSAAPNTMDTRGKDKRPRALPSAADAWRFLLAAPTRRGRPPPRRPFSPFRLRRRPGCWVGQLKRPDTLATCCSSTHGGNEAAGSPWSGARLGVSRCENAASSSTLSFLGGTFRNPTWAGRTEEHPDFWG